MDGDITPLGCNPRGSLLELAYKLKLAHERVFGFSLETAHKPNIKTEKQEHRGQQPEQNYSNRIFKQEIPWEQENKQYKGLTPPWNTGRPQGVGPVPLNHIKTEIETESVCGDSDDDSSSFDSFENCAEKPDDSENNMTAANTTYHPVEIRPTSVQQIEEETPDVLGSADNVAKDDDDDENSSGLGTSMFSDNSVGFGSMRAIYTPSSANVHVMSRKYQCQSCDYQTDNKSHLTRHETGVHSLVKPYCCPVCQTEFSRSEKAKGHMLKKHPDVLYDARLIRRNPTSDAPKRMKRNASWLTASPRSVMYTTSSPPRKVARVDDGTSEASTPGSRPTENYESEASLDMSCDVIQGQPTACSLPENQGHPTAFSLPENQGHPTAFSLPENQGQPTACSLPENQGHPTAFSLPDNQGHPTACSLPEKRFECSHADCNYRARDVWHLRRHVSDVHNQMKNYKCAVCSYASSRKHRLVSHMKAHGQLYCFHCDFATGDINQFNTHVQICSLIVRNEYLRCKRCGQAFVNRKNMKDHALKLHDVTLFCCDLCMYWTESWDEYQSHHEQHTASKSEVKKALPASLWDSRKPQTSTKSDTTEPQCKVEEGEEEAGAFDKGEDEMLHCSFCKYTTKYRSIMRNHLHKHSEEKLQCEVPKCSFRTSWRRSMELHMKAFHPAADDGCGRGRGEFHCPYCPDKPPFVYKKSFDKHVVKHREEADKCPLCDETFIMPSELKLHLDIEHRVDNSDSDSDDGAECEQHGNIPTSVATCSP